MSTFWLIVACWLGYCAGRLVSAFKYLPYIDRANRRNADLEHRLDRSLDWEGVTQIQLYERKQRINHA